MNKHCTALLLSILLLLIQLQILDPIAQLHAPLILVLNLDLALTPQALVDELDHCGQLNE